MIKVYYLTVEGISSSVFESQVYSLKKEFDKDDKIDFNLIIGQIVKSRISIKKFLKLFFEKKVSFLMLKNIINYKKISKKLSLLIKDDYSILHCRNIDAAYVGLLVKNFYKPNIKIIYDVRGYVEGETLFFKKKEQHDRFVKLNNILFSSDIYFSFISKELYELYKKQHKIPNEKIIVCNSAYNDMIFKIEKNNLESKKINVIYIGGNQSYQNIERIENYFSNIESVNLTIATTKSLNKKSNSKIKYLSDLSPTQLSTFMNNFDYGVLYRENHLFNKIATPTKVTEYWGKGLKIIAFGNAGAYTKDILHDLRLGFVIEDVNIFESNKLAKVSFDEKKYISSFAKKKYSLSVNLVKYNDLYSKLS